MQFNGVLGAPVKHSVVCGLFLLLQKKSKMSDITGSVVTNEESWLNRRPESTFWLSQERRRDVDCVEGKTHREVWALCTLDVFMRGFLE